jgi:hypothetical protein
MAPHNAAIPLACILALLAQSCVQYQPAVRLPPPPQPPPYPARDSGLSPGGGAPQQDPGAGDRAVDALVAPIALYPDPLVAIILPASTFPSEVTAASAYLVQYGDRSRLDSQPWDPSVRALAHYPAVTAWMAQNIAWVQALGAEFASSPALVMDHIQRLRARAMAAGTLTSTQQQLVFSDDGAIEIVPAEADSLYVPVYESDSVYSLEPYYGFSGPYINFLGPFPEGIWLSYCFDWRQHRVWSGGGSGWSEHGGWSPHHFRGNGAPPGAHRWHPGPVEPGSVQPLRGVEGRAAPAPRPMPGAPTPPAERTRSPAAQQGSAASRTAQGRDSIPGPGARYGAPPAASGASHYSPGFAPAEHAAPAPAASASTGSSSSSSSGSGHEPNK